MGLVMGYELKLFDAIVSVASEESPATSQAIADAAKLRERYVREWLCLLASGHIIQVDSTGQKFWISKEHVEELSGSKPSPLLVSQQCTLMSTFAYPSLIKVFQPDGPLGMDNSMFNEFDKRMAQMSDSVMGGQLVSHFLPAVGVQAKLEQGGANVLDVGCGTGGHLAELAMHYPKSFFTGIDMTADAIVLANKRKEGPDGGRLGNLKFHEMNAQKLSVDWANKFDLVTVFDACHDQTRPDLSLKEIHRMLKADGVFAMIEVDGTGNVYKDREVAFSTFFYGASLLHCLPVGCNAPDALQLGAMWGRPKAIQLLNAAGFSDVQAQKSPFKDDTVHVLYLCRK